MDTRHIKVGATDSSPDHPGIAEAARLVREGRLVAFPTETVYGLGADAGSAKAVEQIFQAKGRPQDNPLIVHIAERSHLEQLTTDITETVQKLTAHFWPGPLTLVLPARSEATSPNVRAGLQTVAVRMPDHPAALHLIQAAGCPLAAPSANRSGRPSPTRAEHVLEDLNGRISAVLDSGPTGIGLESTVAAVHPERVEILRPGGVTASQLKQVLGSSVPLIEAAGAYTETAAPSAPGMKYTHYAPRGSMVLIVGNRSEIGRHQTVDRVQQEIDAAAKHGQRTGILTFEEHAPLYKADAVVPCGRLDHPEETAKELYAALRRFDTEKIGFIAAETYHPSQPGSLAEALMNRLMKASGYRVIEL